MSDIVERLMRFAGKVCLSTDTEVEAADEIERLRTENAKFREAELIFSKDGQKWRTAISIFKEQDAKIDKLENIIEDDAKLILRVRMENEKLREALRESDEQFMRVDKERMTLRAALKPFAELALHVGSMSSSDGVCVYVSDLRAAAAALKETGDE